MVVGVKLRATPVATSSSPGRTSTAYSASAGDRASHRWPPASTTRPTTMLAPRAESPQHAGEQGERDDEPGERGRHHRQAGHLGGHAQRLLEVEGDQDERRGAGRPAQHAEGDAEGHRPGAEQLQRDERVGDDALGEDERRQQHRRQGRAGEHRRRGPALLRHGERGADEREHGAGDRGRAEGVEAAAGPAGGAVEQAGRQDEPGQGHRHRDEEDPRPAEGPGHQPAGDDAGGAAEGRRGAPRAHRPGALRTGEHHQEEGHRGGAEGGGAGTLDHPGGDEHALARRRAGQERAGREHGRAGEEHPAATDHVGRAPGEQQQGAEGQDVGVDHPGEPGGAQAEVVLDRRQGDVDDRGVQHDDELGRDQHRQGRPAPQRTARRPVGGGPRLPAARAVTALIGSPPARWPGSAGRPRATSRPGPSRAGSPRGGRRTAARRCCPARRPR